MTWGELERQMRRGTDYKFYRHRTNHDEWINPKTGKTETIGRHKSQEVPHDVLEKILKRVGLK